jgi:hypothetical protein
LEYRAELLGAHHEVRFSGGRVVLSRIWSRGTESLMFARAGRGLPAVRWLRAGTARLLALVLLAVGLVVLPTGAAHAAVQNFDVVTMNIEGTYTTGGGGTEAQNKFYYAVRPLAMRQTTAGTPYWDAIGLQEVGQMPDGVGYTHLNTWFIPTLQPPPAGTLVAPGGAVAPAPPATYTVQEWQWNLGSAGRPINRWVYYLAGPAGGHEGMAIVTANRLTGAGQVFVVAPQPIANGTLPVNAAGAVVNRPTLGVWLANDVDFWTGHARPFAGNDAANILNAVAAATAAMPGAAAGTPPNWIFAGDLNVAPAALTAPAGTTIINTGQPTQFRGDHMGEWDYAVTNQAGLPDGYHAVRQQWPGFGDHVPVGIGYQITAAATGQISSQTQPGKCLDAAVPSGGTITGGTPLQLNPCDQGSATQVWTTTSDGKIAVNGTGFCLDNYNGSSTEGNLVQLWPCTYLDAAQSWVLMPNGTVVNPASGKCLDATPPVNPPTPPPGSSSAGASLRTCTGGATQQFDVPGAPTPGIFGQITPANDPSSCLQTAAPVPGGWPTGTFNLTVTACNSQNQGGYWTLGSNGTARNAIGTCLDNNYAAATDGNRVSTYPCAAGQTNQQWSYSFGEIVNSATNMCLDSTPPTTAGGQSLGPNYPGISLSTCNRSASQQWNIAPPVPANLGAQFLLENSFYSDYVLCAQPDGQAILERNPLSVDPDCVWQQSGAVLYNAGDGLVLTGSTTNGAQATLSNYTPYDTYLQTWKTGPSTGFGFGISPTATVNSPIIPRLYLNGSAAGQSRTTPFATLTTSPAGVDDTAMEWYQVYLQPGSPPVANTSTTQMSIASDGSVTGELTANGTSYVSGVDPAATWSQVPFAGVSQIAVATDSAHGPLIAVLVNGNVYAYQGTGSGVTNASNWVYEWAGGARQIAVASDPTNGLLIGVALSNGNAYVKQGGLSTGWVLELTGVSQLALASDPTNGSLIGVINNGNTYVKQGGLSANWVAEDNNGGDTQLALASDPTNGTLIGVIDNGNTYVKQGVNATNWVAEDNNGGDTQLALASNSTNGTLIGVIDNGNTYVKQSVNATNWVTVWAGGADQLALAIDPNNGPVISVISNGNPWAKVGSLSNSWM